MSSLVQFPMWLLLPVWRWWKYTWGQHVQGEWVVLDLHQAKKLKWAVPHRDIKLL